MLVYARLWLATGQSAGRYLYLIVPIIGIFFLLGLSEILSLKRGLIVLGTLIAGLIWLNIVCLAFYIRPFYYVNSRVGTFQVKSDKATAEIVGGKTIGQSFVSFNKLSAVAVLIGTFQRHNSGNVIFHLKSWPASKNQTDISVSVNASEIKDNQFHVFTFRPIIDSKNKRFYFYVDSPKSVPGNAVAIWYSSKDNYSAGSMYVNGSPSSGDLAFMTFVERYHFLRRPDSVRGSEISKLAQYQDKN